MPRPFHAEFQQEVLRGPGIRASDKAGPWTGRSQVPEPTVPFTARVSSSPAACRHPVPTLQRAGPHGNTRPRSRPRLCPRCSLQGSGCLWETPASQVPVVSGTRPRCLAEGGRRGSSCCHSQSRGGLGRGPLGGNGSAVLRSSDTVDTCFLGAGLSGQFHCGVGGSCSEMPREQPCGPSLRAGGCHPSPFCPASAAGSDTR